MEEWHKRIPNYQLAPNAELFETGGQLGLTALPLIWEVQPPSPGDQPELS